MREQKTNAQVKKYSNNYKIISTPFLPPQHPLINQPPPPDLSHPPIICNNNTMDINSWHNWDNLANVKV